MHSNNLGLYQVVDAEGILFLAELESRVSGVTLEQGLKLAYDSFRRWASSNRVYCSTRPWKHSHFHLGPDLRHPTQHPWLNLKAYNGRCVLAWLAVARMHII